MNHNHLFLSTAVLLTSGIVISLGSIATRSNPEPVRDTTTPAVQLASAESSASAVSPGQQEVISAALRGAHFVPNEGQWADETVVYGFRTAGIDVAFRESTLTMHMQREKASTGRHREAAAMDPGAVNPLDDGLVPHDEPTEFERLTLEVTFPGSNDVTPQGADAQGATFNYYIGDDESQWASEVPSYGTVIYEDLYDGIDLHVMGADGGVLKYEFHCAPGSDHSQVQVRYEGIDSLRIEEETGDLLIDTFFGTLRDGAPVVWEGDFTPRDERIADHTVPARFETLDSNTYTIALLSERDPSRPLVIDPEIEWMKYLGGSNPDSSRGIAVNEDGYALMTGSTGSPDFVGAINSPYSAPDSSEVFVLKVSPSGELQWMTYLGGSGPDGGQGIAVDSAGYALVAGDTRSDDFAGANNSQPAPNNFDGFALKVSPSGELQWMTYLGGSNWDQGRGIAVDDAGNAFVTGETGSPDFAGAINSYSGVPGTDAFTVKVSPSGELQWMKFLGGSGSNTWADRGHGIAVNDEGYALVAGGTRSDDFPGAINSPYSAPDGRDAFALKISPSGELQWMTYLGGSGSESGRGIAIDNAGNALVAGDGFSDDFAGANNSNPGGNSGFALKVSPSGELQWMTYLGGSESEQGHGIAVDDAGNALVAGVTKSTDFAGAINAPYSAPEENDGFALKVSPSGEPQWMTYLGGSDREWVYSIAVDGAGNALVAGSTRSPDFAGAINAPYSAPDETNAFVVRLATPPAIPGDLTGDGSVGVADLLILIGAWGDCPDCDDCPADLTGNCTVGVADLLILINNWG